MKGGKKVWQEKFDPEKGFGFINSGEGEDIFVHYSQIQEEGYRSLEEGQEVTFELSRTTRGLQARNVVKVLA